MTSLSPPPLATMLLATATMLGSNLPAAAQRLHYPDARRGNEVDDYFGTSVPDPYRWLEDVDAPETRRWIEAENALTFSYLGAIPARDAIRRRLTALWDYPRYGTPFKKRGAYFYFKNNGLQNQSVLYRQATAVAEPTVLLDPNTLSADGTVALSTLDLSEDARYLAYATAASGSDWNDIHLREVATGRDLPDAVRRHSLLAARPWQLLGRSRECAEGGLEGGQTAADHVGLLQAGAARGPLGVHRRADSLQRGERVSDPGAVGGVLRDLLAQGVQRLRQIIGAPLDIGPPGGRVGGSQPAGRFGDAHRVMQGRAFRVRIDEPGPPARRGCRAAAGGARDQGDQAGQDKDAQQDPEPDQAGAGGGDGRRGTSGRRLGGGGRRDAGPGRGGRGPARQAADRAADGAPASRRQQSGGKQGHGEGKSFRRTPHADPSASCVAGR